MCKTYDEATKPASFDAPNQGVSDGYVVANGTLLGSGTREQEMGESQQGPTRKRDESRQGAPTSSSQFP